MNKWSSTFAIGATHIVIVDEEGSWQSTRSPTARRVPARAIEVTATLDRSTY
jgi:hypothetical protein